MCSILLSGVLLLTVSVFGEVTQNEDGTEGMIKFETPTLNDEEAHSTHMPSHLKCDACTAVVFQLTQGFDNFHAKRKSLKEIPESEVYRIVDDICLGDQLQKYGVKEVKKVKRLSGPGLEAEDSPGIMAGGGRWPERMKRMCNLYVEEYEELRLYQEYHKKDGSLHKLLCLSHAHPYLTDVCLPDAKHNKDDMKSKKTEL